MTFEHAKEKFTTSGMNDLDSTKYAYYFVQFQKAFVFYIIFLTLSFCFGYLAEGFLSIVSFQLFRGSFGGIHLPNSKICLIFSTLIFGFSIYVGQLLQLLSTHYSLLLNGVIWFFVFFMWYFRIPTGSSYRPIRNEKLKRKLKIRSLSYFFLTAILYFIDKNIYYLVLSCLLISLFFVSSIAYKIFRCKEDRLT